MHRTFTLLALGVLVIAVMGITGCTDKEKELLKTDNSNLALKVDQKDATILKMSTEALNRRDSLLAIQRANDSLSKALAKTQGLLASAYANNQRQKATIDSLKPLAGDSLRCVEQMNAELLRQKHDLELTAAALGQEIVGWKNRAAADSAAMDSARICFQVREHNDLRPWLSKVVASGKWGLPFPPPEFLRANPITSNPAVKPQPAEKKSRRHK